MPDKAHSIYNQIKRGDIEGVKIGAGTHNGSKYSYVEGVYAHADYGLISCGYNNRYGHPHTEVLQGLAQEGTKVLRTDEMGSSG